MLCCYYPLVRQNCKLQLGELLANRTGRHVLGRAVAYLPVVETRPRGSRDHATTRVSLQSLALLQCRCHGQRVEKENSGFVLAGCTCTLGMHMHSQDAHA